MAIPHICNCPSKASWRSNISGLIIWKKYFKLTNGNAAENARKEAEDEEDGQMLRKSRAEEEKEKDAIRDDVHRTSAKILLASSVNFQTRIKT